MSVDTAILSSEELQRYARHIAIAEIGEQGQVKLKNAKVLVIGCGGLGSPLLQYLAAAGVGTIGIVDDDRIAHSNLQRQILFTQNDIGKHKVEVIERRLYQLNPNLQINTYPLRLTSQNALRIFEDYEIICDGTDNFPTRYLVNDACVLSDKINVFAAVHQFEGQVVVFNFKRKINYRDIFPHPPKPGQVQNCAEAGVLGSMCGLVATYQANEVLKIIVGVGEVLDGKLLTLNTLQHTHAIFTIHKNPEVVIDKLIDYENFCGVNQILVSSITADELKSKVKNDKLMQLVDVREPFEHKLQNIGGINIPLNTLLDNLCELNPDTAVVVYCQSGVRSTTAVQLLLDNGFKNVCHLSGGMNAYNKSNTTDFE